MQQATIWLNTDFGDGAHFFETIASGLAHQQGGGPLHYVGLTEAEVLPAHLQAELRTPHGRIGTGFHRFHLRDGRVSLTLCVGKAHALLAELRMQADAVIGPNHQQQWNRWTWKLLAKQCRRGSTLHPRDDNGFLDHAALRESGFHPSQDPAHPWVFDPHWRLTRTDRAHPPVASSPSDHRCAVIGAGLAGASVAYALASRGWQVAIVDRKARVAGGGSGIPAGLAVPHASRDDNPRSRLTRAGISLLHQHAHQLLEAGIDWSPSGVLELSPGSGQWHPQACWVRPSRLIEGWMEHSGIRFLGEKEVRCVDFAGHEWELRDARGNLLAAAPHVVIANALAFKDLSISPLPDRDCVSGLRGIRGVMSIGHWPPDASEGLQELPFPVNGDGSFLPQIPGPDGVQWHCGATFEQECDPEGEVARGHTANAARLGRLLPDIAKALAQQWESPGLKAWSGERCTTHDRLPLAGPLQLSESDPLPGLWCNIGMGSRGLSLAALCAEVLAAEMMGEPLPIEARLRKSLHPDRTRRLTPS